MLRKQSFQMIWREEELCLRGGWRLTRPFTQGSAWVPLICCGRDILESAGKPRLSLTFTFLTVTSEFNLYFSKVSIETMYDVLNNPYVQGKVTVPIYLNYKLHLRIIFDVTFSVILPLENNTIL